MESLRIRKFTVDDIYISVLTRRLVKNAEGWMRFEVVKQSFKPTGSLVMDALGQLLQTCPGLTVKGFAQAIDMPMSTLRPLFPWLTGLAVGEFLTQYRMKRACEWLTCTDVPINEVAQHSGFPSASSMTNYFKARLKSTPRNYRKKNRPADFRTRYNWE